MSDHPTPPDAGDHDVPGGATAAERGETTPRPVRWLLRGVVLLLVAASVTAVALVRHQVPDGSASGAAPSGDVSASAGSPAPRARHERAWTVPRMQQEAAAVAAEDARLARVTLLPASHTGTVDGTLSLGARPAPYSWAFLQAAGAIHLVAPGIMVLTESVVVRRGASLDLSGPGLTLRMLSTPRRFTSVVGWGGSIVLGGAPRHPLTVESWDPGRGGGDIDLTDGRAYLRLAGGATTLSHLRLRHLGFWSGRTGGLALTGTGRAMSGSLDDVTISDPYLGLYASGVTHLDADTVTIRRSRWYGVYVSDRSHDVRIARLSILGAAAGGITVNDGSEGIDLSRARVIRTGGYGLAMDGSPLGRGPNAAGYGPANSAGLDVSHARFVANVRGGISIRAVDQTTLTHVTAEEESDPIRVDGRSHGTRILASTLIAQQGPALLVAAGAQRVRLSGSRLTAPAVGVSSLSSGIRVDHDRIRVGTGHGIVVEGGSAVLAHLAVSGRGSAAVAVHGGASVSRSAVTGVWSYRPAALLWAQSHAAFLPLVPVGIVPLIGLAFVLRRAQRHRRLRAILHAAVTAQGRHLLDSYHAASPPPPVVASLPDVPDVPEVADVPEIADVPDVAEVADPRDLPGVRPEPPSLPRPRAPERESEPAARDIAETGSGVEAASFESIREFAATAVSDLGYTPAQVARVLHVPTSRVRGWLQEA